jgi:predicted ATPase/DNA-binding SARP family transcriptional activator
MSGVVGAAVLGPVQLTIDGAPVPIGGAKTQLLLARLALAAPKTVPADALIDSLWGERPPATARKTLQKYVSVLRDQIGHDVLATVGPGYALALDAASIDSARFEQLRQAARSARVGGEPQRAWDLLAEAMALWRGRPLAGLDDVPFVAAAVAELEEARLTTEEEQLEVGLDLGRHASLLARIERLATDHPYRERLWAALMLALYRSGRQADALAAFRRIRTLLAEELGIEPYPVLRELEGRILRQDADLIVTSPVPAATTVATLPVPLTSFVGRTTELGEIGELLAAERLITLVGPGGSGKTRLALEAAIRNVARYPDGVHLVDLASVTSVRAVTLAVAAPLGVSGQSGRSTEAVLAEYLAGRELLLVVDNCEHLADGVAHLLATLLGAAPRLRVLATSREPLGVPGEARYEVLPLPVPDADDPPDDIEAFDGVRLFVDRARSADPHFRLTEANAPEVAQICRRLDGIPLALELAAPRVRAFGTAQLVRLLDDRFAVLTSSLRGVLPRHQTLSAAVDWSYALLAERARSLFRRLSVFRGGFDLDATAQVCGFAPLDPGDVIAVLPELVDKSLVATDHRPDRTTRYRLLETLREYGHAHLTTTERAEVRGRHAAHFGALAERAAVHLRGPEQHRWIARLTEDYPNLRESMCWAFDEGPELGIRYALALADYWDAVGPRLEAHDCLRRAVERSGSVVPKLRIAALVAASDLFISTEPEFSERFAEQALDEAREIGDDAWVARSLRALALVYDLRGVHERAAVPGRQALAIFRRLGADWDAALSLERLGQFAKDDPDRAMSCFWESLALFRKAGDRRRTALVLYKMAQTRVAAWRDLDAALCWVRESLSIGAQLGTTHDIGHADNVLGWVLRRLGRPGEARCAFEAAVEIMRRVGDQRCTARSLSGLGVVLIDEGEHDQARKALQESLEIGRTLDEKATTKVGLAGVARLLTADGRFADAATLHAIVERLGRELRMSPPPAVIARRAAALDVMRASLDPDTFDAAWRAGAAMGVDEAIALALRPWPAYAQPTG